MARHPLLDNHLQHTYFLLQTCWPLPEIIYLTSLS
nr:MAG TPA: hypothetical protein [Caudoviricetes sp.]